MTRPDNNSSLTSSIHSVRQSNPNRSVSNFSSNGFGFEQQTFLGASIRSVGMSAGYGDSVSTLSVELINDEYNVSDGLPFGEGDDVYHNGTFDRFSPPPVGSPVYFKLGLNKASVDQAYQSIYNTTYNTNIFTSQSGVNHLCFGGILQSYVQNRGPGGNPLYSVQVVDPREILSNVELILNNYAGTTFNHKNIFNIYGFLEYNLSDKEKEKLEQNGKKVFTKITNQDGTYYFTGDDTYGDDVGPFGSAANNLNDLPSFFPITGTGFSRRSSQGMPFFRVAHGLNALLGIYGKLPQEYIDQGFGSFVNFRGFNYVVDLSGLKSLPPYYFIDFDQINLLDLCLEICDITNSELFVSLLPIIPDHPASSKFYQWNQGNPSNFIAGIIRIDSIDKSFQPEYGAIKKYIDNLTNLNIPVENQDVGFELSNNVTDKFIVGAQQVDLYLFSGDQDRDEKDVRNNSVNLANQWRMKTSLQQQILPYYGLIGNKAVTIPKGYGAYQQILLDSSSLAANGVGNYYVATELELRSALVSYEKWSEFLLMYNDIYIEQIGNTPEYTVTVPRSVFDSENNTFGDDDLPSSPCNPPYGYPLYYKRATKLGIQGAGLSSLYARFNRVVTSISEISGATTTEELTSIINNIWEELSSSSPGDLTQAEKELIAEIQAIKLDITLLKKASVAGLVQRFEGGMSNIIKTMNRLSNKTKENAQKVYSFVRNIAEECLGKKFLVYIPSNTNKDYKDKIKYNKKTGVYQEGPFGFNPAYNPIKFNFNPLLDNYEYNYKPEKQGGYINFDLLNNIYNSSCLAISQGLIPQDLTNFISDNSRISSYVRFNHSENLSFNGVSSDSFSQQVVLSKYFIPDLINYLDNVGDDRSNFAAFADKDSPNINQTPKPNTIAFLKCDIDENFYMPPKSILTAPQVFGKKIKNIWQYIPPVKEFDPVANKWDVISPARKVPYLVPDNESVAQENTESNESEQNNSQYSDLFFARNKNGIINTDIQNLDTDHVYALITLPSRVVPTMDSRFRDGPQQTVNPLLIKHLLTMDVVKIPEFEDPKPLKSGSYTMASEAYNVALEKSINFALPNLLSFISPSPVYPNLVAIPLLSKERCYGPWLSAPNQAGGKVEFVKDENLAPWNFSGYDLMNQAGSLRAQFTSSLLLQSERGGFVTPTVPGGIALGRFLANAGPLITNISLDISEAGVKSTVKMDLYTVSFGKLQKAKENIIANISRERQKLKDERNGLIRQGISKNMSNINYQILYKYIKNQTAQSISNSYSSYKPPTPSQSNLVASITGPQSNLSQNFGDAQFSQDYYDAATLQTNEEISTMLNTIPNDLNTMRAFYNTGQSDLRNDITPISMEPHANMAYVEDNNIESYNDLYNEANGET